MICSSLFKRSFSDVGKAALIDVKGFGLFAVEYITIQISSQTQKEERDLFQGRVTSVHSHPEHPQRNVEGMCVLAVRCWV